MIRWLWPLLAAFTFAVSFSAMRFDRINHSLADKREWKVAGLEIPLSNTNDFYVWATPMVGGAFLICAALLWLVAREAKTTLRLPFRLPPVGPFSGRDRLQRIIDKSVRVAVSVTTMGLAGYTLVHLLRHWLKNGVFDHSTKQLLHGPGLLNHLSHWSVSGDLRYGTPEGITYYAGFQPTVYLIIALAGFLLAAFWLASLARSVRKA